jgi:hypothetical protein
MSWGAGGAGGDDGGDLEALAAQIELALMMDCALALGEYGDLQQDVAAPPTVQLYHEAVRPDVASNRACAPCILV